MRKINRKRLNNKGFTLIELLAVVVILAIVMGIAANGILNSINNSRKSSFLSAAKNAANTLNTWYTEDQVITDATQKTLDVSLATTVKDSWALINSDTLMKTVYEVDATGAPTTTVDTTKSTYLMKALGLTGTDIKTCASGNVMNSSTGKPDCSGIRYNSSTGGFEIVLVVNSEGKYYVNGVTEYAFSGATEINSLS